MFKNLYNNLTKKQKIGFFLLLQILIIAIAIAFISNSLQPKNHIEISDNNNLSSVPTSQKNLFKDQLWNVLVAENNTLKKSAIDDIVIREDSYSESTTESGITTADFIIDIDSIKQTYRVSISWSTKGAEIPNSISINCPKKSEMKYSETFCQTAYNNTQSLDLYLPYFSPSQNNSSNEEEYSAPNFSINGNESRKTITITTSICDSDKYKKEALEYLKTTPIDLNQYQINYEINSTDVNC